MVHWKPLRDLNKINLNKGKLLWKGRYDAWGSLIRDSYREAASGSHQPFRLQNQYFDEETGLHYNFFLYYESVLGRFITQDPIKLAGGNNLYRFEGTVQNQVDLLGLSTYKCTRQLGQPSGTDAPWLFNHTYLCTGDPNNPNNMFCSSTTQKQANMKKIFKATPSRPTTAEEDSFSISHCKEVSSESCVESCTEKRLKDPMSRKPYAVGPLGEDCQEYSERMLEECKSSCRPKRKNWNFL